MMSYARIAVVAPPKAWLEGLPLGALHTYYLEALQGLGIETAVIPHEAVVKDSVATLARLRLFRPEAVIAFAVGFLLMDYRENPSVPGWRPHFFADILDVPVICIWDHAPYDFANRLLGNVSGPRDSRGGALADIRCVLAHPRMIHWCRDSGQRQIMVDLGFAKESNIIVETPPVLPAFVRPAPADGASAGVAFVGYFQPDLPRWKDSRLQAIADDVEAEWVSRFDEPLWERFAQRIAERPQEEREELRLDADQSFFWTFAVQTMDLRAQHALRLSLLAAAKVPINVYGNLPPHMAPANLRVAASFVPFGPMLADTFARHELTIDVLSPGFRNGTGHKPLLVFAAGGFALLNRKRDLVDMLGGLGEKVSFSNAAELASKVEYYLGSPRERRELAMAIRDKLVTERPLHRILATVLAQAAALPTERAATFVVDALPAMRRERRWPWQHTDLLRTEEGVIVEAAANDRRYAARLALPESVSAMRNPKLRLSVTVQRGRIGVGVVSKPRSPESSALLVDPSGAAAMILLDLPHDPAAMVVLRNASDGPVRAIVSEVVVYDAAR